MTMFSVWVARLGLTYVLLNVVRTGIVGAWYAMFADWAFRAALSVIWFRTGRWKKSTI